MGLGATLATDPIYTLAGPSYPTIAKVFFLSVAAICFRIN